MGGIECEVTYFYAQIPPIDGRSTSTRSEVIIAFMNFNI